MTEKKDELLNHDYDGIQEYDNDLPKWWQQLFWVTVIFSLIYVGYYHFGSGMSQEQILAKELEKAESSRPAAPVELSDSDLIALASTPAALAKGKSVFDGKCAACHGAMGQGLVGPNLTDDNWIHGGKATEIKKVIVTGVLEKGMLAWKGLLTEEEINSVTAYIWSIHGSNPPNPKAPEGELVPRS